MFLAIAKAAIVRYNVGIWQYLGLLDVTGEAWGQHRILQWKRREQRARA